MAEPNLTQLLERYTQISSDDKAIIETLCGVIKYIANLTESDVFIDALTTNGYDSIVLCWAKPPQHSLYSQSVVGKLAHPFDEPAVYKTLLTGEPSYGVRGLNQERTPIAQTVVPVTGIDGSVIAALIMEKDITQQVYQEAQVEILSETAEQLSRTLMGLTVNKTNFADQLRDGVVVLDEQGGIKYINWMGTQLFYQLTGSEQIPCKAQLLPEPLREVIAAFDNNAPWAREIGIAQRFIRIEGIPLLANGKIEGAIIILSDLTALREKEKELILKSVAIQEIHHRVKNNLQNIASLLRLQMRRTANPELKVAFAESINRILSMSLVYDVLASESIDEVELKELCNRVVRLLLDNTSLDCTINCEVVGNSLYLPSNEAVTLTLIVNELASNSLKHGFVGRQKGTLTIQIQDDDREVLLSIKDDGIGLPEEPNKPGHLGLQIVKVLAEEKLGGCLVMRREKGTVASMRFPKRWAKEG